MKSFILKAMLLLAVVFGGATMASAQSKALKKDVKKTIKEMKKAGWEIYGQASTLEYALTKYRTYMEEDEENRIALTGLSSGKNIKIGRENAIMNGITSYAGRAKAQVVGKMKSLMSAEADGVSEEEIDRFGAAYEMGVNTKIAGLVKQHFMLVRDVDGKKEFQVFMSIDEQQARKAREAAAKEARQKARLEDLSEQVENFIGEPVEEY